jgi:hypothetical protein
MVTSSTSPDPIDDPHSYQRLMLDVLGDDDPALVQEATADALRQLAEEAGPLLRTIPEPGEWSVAGCIAHLVDDEIAVSARYRWILAHHQPVLMGFDQDLWVERLHPPEETMEEMLALFEPLRAANLALWRRSSSEQRARVGMHSERGAESYELLFRMTAGHDRIHLDQAQRTLMTVRTPI